MTNGLLIFLALYILVGQPAIIGWMIDNTQLYELAWLNAWIFLIAVIISSICKPNKSKPADNSAKLVEKSEERVSRIENDNGVSIVEVEKKTEVVVQANNENTEENLAEPEKLEEKVEEKPEEKAEERPMKETVTIPKIVQPLTWHQPTKRKRNIQWGQRIVLLITLALAVIIACTLWEFLGTRWIAIALFLWWILYLVIGKLFDIDGFYNAKKIFTNRLYIALILAGIGYGIYTSQNEEKSFMRSDLWDKVSSYFKGRFESEEEDNSDISTWNMVYIFEWTGEVITDIEDNTSIVDEPAIEDEIIEDTQPSAEEIENTETQPAEETEAVSPSVSAEEADEQATMWEVVKSLLAWTTLSTKTNITFTYISKSSSLYPYFKTAQEKWMIWKNANPDSYLGCETFITMKWLAEWWNVWDYVKSEIKTAYWNKAVELWKLNGCEKWNYVTKWNL